MRIATLVTLLSLCHCVMAAKGRQPSANSRITLLEREIIGLKSKAAGEISTKKLRKLIRREMKNKLLPKLQKNLNDLVEKSVGKKVSESVEDVVRTYTAESTVSLTMFNDLQNRMDDLADENAKLLKSLQANSQTMAARLGHLQRSLRLNCNCEVLLKESVDTDAAMPAFTIQKVLQGGHTDNFGVVPSYPLVGNASRNPFPEVLVEAYEDDMTFNVSLDSPDFRNRDSLLLVDEEGLMTRVSFSNTSIRATLSAAPFVEGVAYDSVSKKIFWGSNRNQRKAVYSVNADGTDLTKVLDGRWVFSLAVDGRRRRVFMTDWDLRVVSVMNTNGNSYKILTNYNDDGDPRTIALDTQRRLLYVSYTFAIVKMKYDGSRIRRVTGGIWMQTLTLDVPENILYYSIKKNIYRVVLSASNKTSKFVNQMDSDLSYLAFHDGSLYISYQNWVRSVDVLHLKDNILKHFVHVEATSLLRLSVLLA